MALALLGIVEEKIDLVVSGINPNANLGHDVTYSGTVTAAMEAAIILRRVSIGRLPACSAVMRVIRAPALLMAGGGGCYRRRERAERTGSRCEQFRNAYCPDGVRLVQDGVLGTAVVQILVGLLIMRIGKAALDKVLPPIVTGSIAIVIGISLAGAALGMASGRDAGGALDKATAHWLVALVTLVVTVDGPFAALERLLVRLVADGADRQEMHERLRQHAMTAWQDVQQGQPNPLTVWLLAMKRLPLM